MCERPDSKLPDWTVDFPWGWVDIKISFPLFWLFGALCLITWRSASLVNENPKYCLHYFTNTGSPDLQPSLALLTAGGIFAVVFCGVRNDPLETQLGHFGSQTSTRSYISLHSSNRWNSYKTGDKRLIILILFGESTEFYKSRIHSPLKQIFPHSCWTTWIFGTSKSGWNKLWMLFQPSMIGLQWKKFSE